MEGKEKTIAYAFAAACILGLIIVGALVLKNPSTEEAFSELYFEDPDTLPGVVNIGDKIDFAFTTVSHEKKQTAYDYKVTYDGHDIRSGSFSLEPSSSKTINASVTPKDSSQVKTTDPVVNISKMKYNAASGTISSQDYGFDRMKILTSPSDGYSLVVCGANTIKLQIADGVGLLIFDPKRKESYNTSVRTVIPEVGLGSSDGQFFSDIGYIIRRDDWNIVNDRGNIDILHKKYSTVYRYALKKVSVKVSSAGSEIRGTGESEKPAVSDTRSGSEYEIHFWITVKEDPDKLQNMR
ncbi:hypothetical protein [Methanothrix sp.]|jgi:hypothetical protein|uniref:hypothetical protein n=1 Tax=Methanothrix sp. TaxID=90426 RepID=UPI003BB5FFE7